MKEICRIEAMTMPRYPEPHRQPPRQAKRAPAPKKKSRQAAHPQQARPVKKAQPARKAQPTRQQSQSAKKAQPVKKPVQQPKKVQQVQKVQKPQQPHYSSLLFFLWAALAFPELVLHLSTAKSGEMLFNSGLLLGPVFAVLPAFLVFALCTSLPRRRTNRLIAILYTGLCFLLCAASWSTTGSSAPSTPSSP